VRIASVSDLHTDYAENRELVVALATEIHRRGVDAVIVAGDVSHKDDRIRRALAAFREVAPEVLYVPGNHDLWFDVADAPSRPELDTWRRYRELLPALVEAEGAIYLPKAPFVRLGIGFAGACGWYDYSFLLPELRAELGDALGRKQLDGFMWADSLRTAFRTADGAIMDDARVARIMERELAAQLDALEAREDVRCVVAVTHHLAFEEAVYRSRRMPWEFFNGFMGSRGMGEVIGARAKVAVAIYGHTHFTGDRRLEIGGRSVRVVGTALGYPRERFGASAEEVVATRIAWLEL